MSTLLKAVNQTAFYIQLRTQTYTRVLPFVFETSNAVLRHGFSFDATVVSKGLNRRINNASSTLVALEYAATRSAEKFYF